MKIINILEIINGIPNSISSFPVYEEQLEQDVVDKAEELFTERIAAHKKSLPTQEEIEEELEYYLDNGSYTDKSGYELYIICSYVN